MLFCEEQVCMCAEGEFAAGAGPLPYLGRSPPHGSPGDTLSSTLR